MTNYRCTGDIRFEFESDATEDSQIIMLANSLSIQRWGEGLDSLDLGDSMGAFIRAAVEDFYAGDLDSMFIGEGFYARINLQFELFNWGK